MALVREPFFHTNRLVASLVWVRRPASCDRFVRKTESLMYLLVRVLGATTRVRYDMLTRICLTRRLHSRIIEIESSPCESFDNLGTKMTVSTKMLRISCDTTSGKGQTISSAKAVRDVHVRFKRTVFDPRVEFFADTKELVKGESLI